MKKRTYRKVECVFQIQFIEYCWGSKNADLNSVFAIPNGARLPLGHAVQLKRQGLKAGVADVCLPRARGKYNALYLEFKGKGSLSPNQKQFKKDCELNNNGYVVVKSFDEAYNAVNNYLAIKNPHN